MAGLAPYFFGLVLTLIAIFLILLVLVQRGRGGGLTGALGGIGGSSAFGAKAGDVFTKITIVAAAIWIALCVGAAYWSGHRSDLLGDDSRQLINTPVESTTPSGPLTSDTTEGSGAPTGQPVDSNGESTSAPAAGETQSDDATGNE